MPVKGQTLTRHSQLVGYWPPSHTNGLALVGSVPHRGAASATRPSMFAACFWVVSRRTFAATLVGAGCKSTAFRGWSRLI